MTKQREKHLRCLSPQEQRCLRTVLDKIRRNRWRDLDIRLIVGTSDTYRCRVGSLRILFSVKNDSITIHKIKPRGDSYKNL